MTEGIDGAAAVRAARAIAEAEAEGAEADVSLPPGFSRPMGVFVTISEHPSRRLRGCIGYPEPVFPLGEALAMSARAACHDPRFPDLSPGEARACVFEVTLLTVPEPMDFSSPQDLLSSISVGEDGLIIEAEGRRGLLLPQVPLEFGWGAEEYLRHLSMKAGLDPRAWSRPGARIKRFRGEVYSEESPRGAISRGRGHGP
jgi:uncharacterized protein (TIGR00296 family)